MHVLSCAKEAAAAVEEEKGRRGMETSGQHSGAADASADGQMERNGWGNK